MNFDTSFDKSSSSSPSHSPCWCSSLHFFFFLTWYWVWSIKFQDSFQSQGEWARIHESLLYYSQYSLLPTEVKWWRRVLHMSIKAHPRIHALMPVRNEQIWFPLLFHRLNKLSRVESCQSEISVLYHSPSNLLSESRGIFWGGQHRQKRRSNMYFSTGRTTRVIEAS